jgi:hypothetical protein
MYPDDCKSTGEWPGSHIQNQKYTYDPVGNIVHFSDMAQQTVFFRNQRVDPCNSYTYDALYRLIDATGREKIGSHHKSTNAGVSGRSNHPHDGKAMSRYVERYSYDEVGNILSVQHASDDPSSSGWTRNYEYREPSYLEPERRYSNRLSQTRVGTRLEPYQYDRTAGNITSMPCLSIMRWDYKNQLKATAQQVTKERYPETTWYVYDIDGRRLRKVTESSTTAPGEEPRRLKDRIYLPGFEIFRKYQHEGFVERETLHIMENATTIALVDYRTTKASDEASIRQPLYRYQYEIISAPYVWS